MLYGSLWYQGKDGDNHKVKHSGDKKYGNQWVVLQTYSNNFKHVRFFDCAREILINNLCKSLQHLATISQSLDSNVLQQHVVMLQTPDPGSAVEKKVHAKLISHQSTWTCTDNSCQTLTNKFGSPQLRSLSVVVMFGSGVWLLSCSGIQLPG